MNIKRLSLVGRLAVAGVIPLLAAATTHAAEVRTDHFEYRPSEPITALFSGGPGSKKDWIGVYSEGQTPGGPGSTLWNYVDGTRAGTVGLTEGTIQFNTGLTVPGVWEIYLLENDGYTQLAKSSFTVVEPTAPLVRVDKPAYQVGETISITFSNGPGAAKDWIGIYQEGQTPGGVQSTIWNYVDGTKDGRVARTDGTIVFNGGLTAAGRYVAYLLANDGYTILAREPVTVSAPVAGQPPRVVAAQPPNLATQVPPGQAFSVALKVADLKIVPASVVLKLDGIQVPHQFVDAGADATITFTPTTALAPRSEHTYNLTLSDTAGNRVEHTSRFVVADYVNVQLPPPLYLETFDALQEGALPAGWTGQSYSEVQNEEIDFGNLDSAAYRGWTVVNVDRFKGSFITYSNPDASQGEKDDYKRVLANTGLAVENGKVVSPLADGRMLFGNSGYRRGASQVMFVTTADYDLTGQTGVHLSFHSLWEQNQDSIAAVEYSVDKGATWRPVVYYLATGDVITDANGTADVDATFNTEHGDVARYTDETGAEIGGTYGAFVRAPITPALAPFVQPRVDDSPTDGKRIELFRLEGADQQKTVRFRLAHAGTDSWYWGVDNFGLYSFSATTTPSLKVARTTAGIEISWGEEAAGFTLESAPAVTGAAWTPVPVASGARSVVVPASSPSAFYRLRR